LVHALLFARRNAGLDQAKPSPQLDAEEIMEPSMLRTSLTARSLAGCGLAIALVACGSSAPTEELVDARRAYEDAEDGPAATRRPGELRAARRALDRAEAAHEDDPGSEREKRLAEVAEHRADVADARGEAAQAELAAQAARARANREAQALRPREERVASTAKVDREPVKGDDDVTDMRPAKNVDDDLQGLIHGSTVRQDERGTVIIMSGALLFPSGKSELSDTAEQHLDQVAEALKKQPENRKFRIEGYTDASGSERQNMTLSTNRARAVADYLEDEGIDEDRLTAKGYGEANPIADNDNDEGRASNRRIEIVILKDSDRDEDPND
jgi:outer membrane protein OmpA-like peptidoglycan-associated protein